MHGSSFQALTVGGEVPAALPTLSPSWSFSWFGRLHRPIRDGGHAAAEDRGRAVVQGDVG